jgi:putative ABC transport system permease protein
MALRLDPAVADVEAYRWVEGDWHGAEPGLGSVPVVVSGISTKPGAAMFARLVDPALRARLREPGAVIVDRADLGPLGVGVGSHAWVNGHPLQVVAAVAGLRGLGNVNVLASLATAEGLSADDAEDGAEAAGPTYWVARLRDPADADAVARRLQPLPAAVGPVQLWTAADFAQRSQRYWLLNTGAGVAVLFMAAIVCLVGAVITSQSLTAVVAGSVREYAVLNALGASVAALSRVVLEQAAWVGVAGLALAAAGGTALLALADRHDVPVAMTPPVAAGCAALVAALSLLSGLLSVRALLRADPALLLR